MLQLTPGKQNFLNFQKLQNQELSNVDSIKKNELQI